MERRVGWQQTGSCVLTESPCVDGRTFECAMSAWNSSISQLPLHCVVGDRRRSYLSVIGDSLIGPLRIIGFFWLPHRSFPHRLFINFEGVICALAPLGLSYTSSIPPANHRATFFQRVRRLSLSLPSSTSSQPSSRLSACKWLSAGV